MTHPKRIYGTATLVGSHWHIEAEPHVLVRLKRVFPRLDQAKAGGTRILDTPEVCRDLEWFCQRYPLSVKPKSRLTRGAKRHRQLGEKVRSILEGYEAPRAIELALPPRDYQLLAANVLLRRRSLLLADDLSLGKTVSAIAAACAEVEPSPLPALVVAPLALCVQWQRQLEKFAPRLRSHILQSGTPYDLDHPKRKKSLQAEMFNSFPDVIIAPCTRLRGWSDVLAGRVRLVVFDEVQEFRTGATARPDKYVAAKSIADAAEYRLGLTATPIYNYGCEYFSIIDLLEAGALGEFHEYLREWCTAGGYAHKAQLRDPKTFGCFLRDQGIMLRRTRSEVGMELPPLSIIPHFVEADAEPLKSVEKGAAELATLILKAGGRGIDKMKIAGEFDALMRQSTGIAKAPYVAAFVRMLVESGEPVVLYGWHREVYGIWLEALKDLNPLMVTGTESPAQKQRNIDDFIAGNSSILIVSLRAGSGIDGLQERSRTAVFGELDWSPGVHEQCIARVDRSGQDSPSFAYMLLSDIGSDPIIADVLGIKRQQIDPVRDPNQDLVERLQVDPERIKKLAADYLRQIGAQIPETAPETEEGDDADAA